MRSTASLQRIEFVDRDLYSRSNGLRLSIAFDSLPQYCDELPNATLEIKRVAFGRNIGEDELFMPKFRNFASVFNGISYRFTFS